MRKYISHFFDEVGLSLLHRKKSKSSQFRDVKEPIYSQSDEDLKKAYPDPSIPDITFKSMNTVGRYRVGTYFYPCNLSANDEHKDNLAKGTYYTKEPCNELVHVILVHGWRSENIDRLKKGFLDPFMALGYNMYFVSLPYHMERSSGADYSGEYMISADVERTIHACRQAVAEIRALIHWLKKYRGGKVILVGFSLGGLMVNLTSTVEEQIDGLVAMMYANKLSHTVWNTRIGKYIQKDLESNGFNYHQLQAHWAILEPAQKPSKVPKENMLFILGTYDRYVEIEDANSLWEAWDRPKRLLYPCGHAGIIFNRKQMAVDVVQFIQSRL
jgi:hypothetical protein